MPLSPGTRLGSYEIIAPVGAGGMGEVYRAHDTTLGRDVALKILPEAFATDPDRLARFEREARALAALNHPNIAQIYGVEAGAAGSSSSRALVMELVSGRTLDEMGALPLSDALALGRQIAEALEAAHDAGIIHRDLKPANIKVRGDGVVKVLDFGLAKTDGAGRAGPEGLLNSPTITSPAITSAGIILGTAAYMSPEQAKGRPIDKRADIWAFGCVLWEMLTGRRLFDADNVTETLAAVLTREPDLNALPRETPAPVRQLLRRCLERDPRRRLRDIGEARIALTDPSGSPIDPPDAATSPVGHPHTPGVAVTAAVIATVIAAALGGAAAVWLSSAAPSPPPLRRYLIGSPKDTPITGAAIAPDGRVIAFMTDDKAWIQRLDELTPREVAGSNGVRAIFWSPDSAFLGVQARGRLLKMPVGGGDLVVICSVPTDFTVAGGAAWLDDGRIVFTTGGTGLMEVPAQGGTPRELLATDRSKEADLHDVSALPGGRGLVFIPHGKIGGIDLYDFSKRSRVLELPTPGQKPVYSPTGHLLFHRDTGTWAVAFSLATLTTSGEPFLVVRGGGQPTVAADGTLAAVATGAASESQLTWVDPAGKVIGTLGRTGARSGNSRISPDGRYVAAAVREGNAEIYVFDIQRGTETRLTFEPGQDLEPSWSPDGRFIVYRCGDHVCSKPMDGSRERQVLLENATAPRVSPDGKYLVFVRENQAQGSGWDLFVVELGEQGVAAPVTAVPRAIRTDQFQQTLSDISPDGRYIAYQSNESGTQQIFVTRFPSGEGKWQVTRDNVGFSPRWSATGDRLLYSSGNALMEVPVDTTAGFSSGAPTPLFSLRDLGVGAMLGNEFERAPDLTRFLLPRATSDTIDTSKILIVQNWFAAHATPLR